MNDIQISKDSATWRGSSGKLRTVIRIGNLDGDIESIHN